MTHICERCKKPFAAIEVGRPKRFCSIKCSRGAARQIATPKAEREALHDH